MVFSEIFVNWLEGPDPGLYSYWLGLAMVLMWFLVVLGLLIGFLYQRQRARTLHKAQVAGELSNMTLSQVSDGVIHTDANGLITFCNTAAAKIIGMPAECMVGQPFGSTVRVYKGEEQTLVENPAKFLLASDQGVYLDRYSGLRTASGAIRPILETISPVRDQDGTIAGAVFVFHDVSDARDLSDQLVYQARHDHITGLPNRVAFEESLRDFVINAHRRPGRCFLMYLDVDHFKMVNDVYGHVAGDRLLREISALLRGLLRAEDGLARLGGDEFGITLRLRDAGKAQQVAESLISAVGAYRFEVGGGRFEVGLSIGIVAIEAGDSDVSTLMARADTACYAAKDRGRGRSHLYLADDPYILGAQSTLDCANSIQRAFDDDRFEVYLQRIVGRDRKVLGYESLIRMRSETGDVMEPGAFMPAAQRMGWMTRIDQWMLQHVLAVAHSWPAGEGQQPYLSLNLDARSIGDAAFVEGMLALLDASGVDNKILRFEITETDRLQDNATEKYLIDQLHRRGFRVWLDDMGTGYNSFDVLRRIHVDGIKIDRSFTRALVADPVDRALTEALISIGKAMHLEIVAEGVEDEETYQALLDLDADAFQGHRFHRAESAADVMQQQFSRWFGRHEISAHCAVQP